MLKPDDAIKMSGTGNFARGTFAGVGQIIPKVVYTNDKAVNLYKQPGFVEYGRPGNYFKSDTRILRSSF